MSAGEQVNRPTQREFTAASNEAREVEEKRKADEAARLREALGAARANLLSALTALAITELEKRPVNAAKLALAAWPREAAMDIPKREVTLNAVSRSLSRLHERMRITTNSSVDSVAFSPDGVRVLTGSVDKTARLWDAATRTRSKRSGGTRTGRDPSSTISRRTGSLPSPSAAMARVC